MKFKLIKGRGDINKSETSNENGFIECKIYRIEDSRKDNTIEASIDTKKLTVISPVFSILDDKKERIIFPSYFYKQSLRISVCIVNDTKAQEFNISMIDNLITSSLIENGFKIIPFDNKKTKDKADILIKGRVSIDNMGPYISLPDGTNMKFVPSCRATINVKAADNDTGEIIVSQEEISEKGFGRTEKEACDNALRKTGEIISRYMTNKLDELYGNEESIKKGN